MASREEKNNFSLMIEALVEKEGLTYIEAISSYCDRSGLEIEVAATLVNPQLKSKVEMEARALRYLPKSAALPI